MQGPNSLRNFGMFSDMPENLQDAMDYGLSFFELRFQGEKRFSQNIFGFYDVKVERGIQVLRQGPRYDVIWRTGRDAKITFNCLNQKTGLSIALAVDDPFWHNRIVMAFNPIYMIFQLHTPEGQIAGSIISSEIECLRDVCQDKHKQYCVVNQFGKTQFNSYDETEIDQYIAARRGKAGTVSPLRKATRTAWVTKKFVEEIIARNDRTQYGWTNSEDFKRQIKDPTLKLIEERGISRTVESSPSVSQQQIEKIVASTIRDMSIDQIKAILSGKQDKPKNNNPFPENDQETPQVQGTDEEPPEFKTKTFINRMKLEDAVKLARERGIPGHENMTRQELVIALLDVEERRKSEWENKKKLAAAHSSYQPEITPTVPQEKGDTGEEMIAS